MGGEGVKTQVELSVPGFAVPVHAVGVQYAPAYGTGPGGPEGFLPAGKAPKQPVKQPPVFLIILDDLPALKKIDSPPVNAQHRLSPVQFTAKPERKYTPEGRERETTRGTKGEELTTTLKKRRKRWTARKTACAVN
jgi:hypothetical protein